MDISGLMVSTSDWRWGGRDRFPGGEVKNLLFNYFLDSNEGIADREAEITGSIVKCGERPLE